MNNGIYTISKELDDLNIIDKISDYTANFSNYGQLFIMKKDSVFYLNRDNCQLEKVPIKFINNYEPRYINKDLFFYLIPSLQIQRTYFFNRVKKTIDSFKIIGDKEILPYNKNNILLISHRGLYDINIGDQKPIITNSLLNVWIHLKAFDDINKLYFISNKKLLQYNTISKQLTTIDSFYNSDAPIGMHCNDKYLLVLTNTHLNTYTIGKK